ncbi:MAG: hypothetical protein ACYCWW_21090, partial [Deltaproteobacteria bacterium]
ATVSSPTSIPAAALVPAVTAPGGHRGAAPTWLLAGGGVTAVAGAVLIGQAALGADIRNDVTAYTRSEADAANTRGYAGQGLLYGGLVIAAAGLVWMLAR